MEKFALNMEDPRHPAQMFYVSVSYNKWGTRRKQDCFNGLMT